MNITADGKLIDHLLTVKDAADQMAEAAEAALSGSLFALNDLRAAVRNYRLVEPCARKPMTVEIIVTSDLWHARDDYYPDNVYNAEG